jgi:hypothetical protein
MVNAKQACQRICCLYQLPLKPGGATIVLTAGTVGMSHHGAKGTASAAWRRPLHQIAVPGADIPVQIIKGGYLVRGMAIQPTAVIAGDLSVFGGICNARSGKGPVPCH